MQQKMGKICHAFVANPFTVILHAKVINDLCVIQPVRASAVCWKQIVNKQNHEDKEFHWNGQGQSCEEV